MATEREKMLRGERYDPLDQGLIAMWRWARERLLTLNTGPGSFGDDQARQILAELLGSGGDTASIQPPFFCDYGKHIHLGERVFFNFNCVLLDVCEIRIGAFTQVGPGVQIYTASHPLSASERRRGEFGAPVILGEDVWLGGGVIVLPGVTIGDGAVIGAGSVVTRDIPAHVLAVGNPCRVVGPVPL